MILSKKHPTHIIFFLFLLILQFNAPLKNEKHFNSNEKILSSNFQLFAGGISLITYLSNKPANNNSNNRAYQNYIELKKIYIKWNKGLFGSKRHYKRKIHKYLVSILGNEILTDYNYLITSPNDPSELKLVCNLFLERWLQIKGKVGNQGIKSIVESDPEILKEWWRSKKLLSVYGRLKDFRLGKDKWGEVVTLYLSDIRLKESDSIKKNNNK